VEKLGDALNRHSKSVRGSKVLLLGVAYKKDVDDVRESPALEIMEILQDKGAALSYSDPFIPRLHKMRKYDFSTMSSIDLSDETLQAQDVVLITTDHTNIDYQRVVDKAGLVVDTRNATRNVNRGREKIVRA
jgi:UDP-N-acetyl-D-glucosamine dehydrogenase